MQKNSTSLARWGLSYWVGFRTIGAWLQGVRWEGGKGGVDGEGSLGVVKCWTTGFSLGVRPDLIFASPDCAPFHSHLISFFNSIARPCENYPWFLLNIPLLRYFPRGEHLYSSCTSAQFELLLGIGLKDRLGLCFKSQLDSAQPQNCNEQTGL